MTAIVSHPSPGFAIQRYKHGRLCTLAKVVRARPTGEIVIAMPYKSRRLSTPSLPPAAIELARRAGATAWIVRLDTERRCYRLPLDTVEAVGEIGDGGELYVPLRQFERHVWLEWDYVHRTLTV